MARPRWLNVVDSELRWRLLPGWRPRRPVRSARGEDDVMRQEPRARAVRRGCCHRTRVVQRPIRA